MGDGEKKYSGLALLKHLTAGAFAGTIDAIATHPIDTIKTRLQLQSARERVYRGVVHAAVTITKQEGPFALYKGVTPVICGIAPKVALRFAAFELFKEFLKDDQGRMSWQRNLLAGLGAGVVESIGIVTPVEVVKIRLQVQAGVAPKGEHLLHAMKTIVRQEGLRGLYKGLMPTIARQGFQQAVKFSAYNEIKKYIQSDPSRPFTVGYQLLSGGIANSIGAVLNTPIDVIKTRMQAQKRGPVTKYKNSLHCAYVIFTEEGITAFLKGLTPRVLRIGPCGAIQFACYEQCMKLLNSLG